MIRVKLCVHTIHFIYPKIIINKLNNIVDEYFLYQTEMGSNLICRLKHIIFILIMNLYTSNNSNIFTS